jgi:hypothetical protein
MTSTEGPKMSEGGFRTFLSQHWPLVAAGGLGLLFVFFVTAVLVGVALQPGGPPAATDMTIEAFCTQKPKGPRWVKLKHCSIQRRTVTDDQEHYWVRLGSGSGNESAWVIKDSPAGKKVYKIFKDGLDHTCVARLEWYPESAPDSKEPAYRAGQVHIVDIEP